MPGGEYDVDDLRQNRDTDGQFEDDLQEVPYYMREKVSALIDQKVESRVQRQMQEFKSEVMKELDDQRIQNQMHISHYLQHPNHSYAKYPGHGYGGVGYPGAYGRGYPGFNGLYGPRYANSKSPVRRGSKYMHHPAYGYDPRYNGGYYDLDKTDPTIMEISQDLNVSQQKALLDAPLTDRPMLLDQRASIKPKSALKKKKTSKIPKEAWNNKFTNNADEIAKIQKEKIERRKLYDMQLRKKLNDQQYITDQRRSYV